MEMGYIPRPVWAAIIANEVAKENVTDGVNTPVQLENIHVSIIAHRMPSKQ